MLRLRHLWRMSRDVTSFTFSDRMWWLLPVVVVLVVLAFAVTAANSALPYAVYTLF